MEEIVIRDARACDAGRMLEIYAYYVDNTAISFEYTAPSLREFSARIAKTTERYPWLAAEQNGRVTGYAYAGPFKGRAAYDWSCELSVYVDRDAAGQGIGRRLYEELERRLAAMGIRNLYACIAMPRGTDPYLDTNSADFHAHMGFSLAGTFCSCACKFGRWYDMIWMEKCIGEHGPAEPVCWQTEYRQSVCWQNKGRG